MIGKLKRKEKETDQEKRKEEEGSELMRTTDRGEKEMYQKTHAIFNDPCMWRE